MKSVLIILLTIVVLFASIEATFGIVIPEFNSLETLTELSTVTPPTLEFSRQSKREIVEVTWNPAFRELSYGYVQSDGGLWDNMSTGFENFSITFVNLWHNFKQVFVALADLFKALFNNVARSVENIAYKVVDVAVFAGHGAVYLFELISTLFSFDEWTKEVREVSA